MAEGGFGVRGHFLDAGVVADVEFERNRRGGRGDFISLSKGSRCRGGGW